MTEPAVVKKKRRPKPPADEAEGDGPVVDARSEAEPVRGRGVVPRKDAPLPKAPRSAAVTVLRRWLENPEPILRLEVIRIFAPLAVLGFMSSRLAHVDEWLTKVGFQPAEIAGGDWRQPLYLSPLTSSEAQGLAVVMVLSGLCVAAGFKARWAAFVFALTLGYVALADRLAAFTVSKLSPAVMIALACSPVGARLSVDSFLAKRKNPKLALPTMSSGAGPRFFQLLLAVFYCSSGIAKAQGDWLSHKLVLWTHVHDSYQSAFSWAVANAFPAWLWTLLQWVTLIFELGAPVWFTIKKTRPVALAWAVAMHAMIGAMFWPVRWFSLLMITLVVGSFLKEEWLEGLLARFDRA